ncbi:MFS transporter [Ammoniphilus resinae]|uniref:PPP family 3-phenylpropionic acid transporter n=1 Tax=Ammoniphilus resinae TaxID=861532 RepID=A0ABS4GLZ1_9BACL|nr:MFS transporter [Ammoniphilus resinae]MBP1931283.1 PPP family 3-phenylpropionic acid transporter [Ammoniphilus resinae]
MIFLSSYTFLFYASMACIAPFIPLYFQDKGLSPTEIGLVLTAGPFISIFAQPLWGYVSDRRQTVKKVLLLIMVLALLASIGIFSADSFYPIWFFMLLFMFFMTPIQPLSDSLIIAYAQKRGLNYGSIRLWGSVGFSLTALALGMALGNCGIGYLGLIYAVLLTLTIMTSLGLEDSSNRQAKISRRELSRLFGNTSLLWFLFLTLIVSIPARINESMFSIFMNSLGATKMEIGAASLVSAMSEVPVFLCMSLIFRRFSELSMFVLAALLYTCRWLLFSIVDHPTTLIFLQMSQSLTFTLFFAASLRYVTRIVPQELQSTGTAVLTATFLGLAGIIGNSLGGYLIDQFGPRFTYQLNASITFIGTVLALFTYMHLRKGHSTSQKTESFIS